MKCRAYHCNGDLIRVTTDAEQSAWRVAGWVCSHCGKHMVQRLRMPKGMTRPLGNEAEVLSRVRKLGVAVQAGIITWDNPNQVWRNSN